MNFEECKNLSQSSEVKTEILKDVPMRTRILGATLVALALVWTLGAAGDNLCLACVSSKAQLALTGSFGFPSGLCLPAGEPVPLSGNVHVTAKVNLKSLVGNLQLSMAGVSAIGQTSGDLYIGVGTNKRAGIAVAPGLNSFTTDFTLEPTNGFELHGRGVT